MDRVRSVFVIKVVNDKEEQNDQSRRIWRGVGGVGGVRRRSRRATVRKWTQLCLRSNKVKKDEVSEFLGGEKKGVNCRV